MSFKKGFNAIRAIIYLGFDTHNPQPSNKHYKNRYDIQAQSLGHHT